MASIVTLKGAKTEPRQAQLQEKVGENADIESLAPDASSGNGKPPSGGGPPSKPPTGGGGGGINLDGDAVNYTPVTRWIVLFAVMLGTLLEILDSSIVNVSLPQMMGNLGATINEIGWVSTGYIVANVIVLPLTGWLSAYFGRRNYLTGSIILFTIASFLCGHSNTLNELVGFRVVQGMGGAALLSSAQSTLMEVFPRRQLAMVQAIFSVGVVFAPTVGPTLGGFITDTLSWPWIFYVNIPIGIAAAFLVFTFLKDSTFQTKPKGRIDLVGIALLAVGLGCLQGVLEKGNEEGWFGSNLIIGLALVSAITLYSFIVWELSIEFPAVNLRVLKNSGFTTGTLMAMVLGFGLYGGNFIMPVFLQNVRGFSATQAGMALFPGGVATVIALPFIGKALGIIQPRYLVVAGSALCFYAFWGLSYLTIQSGGTDIYLPLIYRGIGVGMLFLPLTLAALTSLTPQEIPGGTGLFNLARQLGGSVGIAFLATYVDGHSTVVRSQLGGAINPFNPIAVARINQLQHLFISRGYGSPAAHIAAIKSLQGVVINQAAVLTYNGGFQIIAACFLVGIPAFFFFPKILAAPKSVPSEAH